MGKAPSLRRPSKSTIPDALGAKTLIATLHMQIVGQRVCVGPASVRSTRFRALIYLSRWGRSSYFLRRSSNIVYCRSLR